jgi:hypothetical protein
LNKNIAIFSSIVAVSFVGIGGYIALQPSAKGSDTSLATPTTVATKSPTALPGTNENPVPVQPGTNANPVPAPTTSAYTVPSNANIGTPKIQGYLHAPEPGVTHTYPPVVPKGAALTSKGIQTVGLIHSILNHSEEYANQFLVGEGKSVRVISRDGKSVTSLGSFSDQNRVNFFVEKGLVISATIG